MPAKTGVTALLEASAGGSAAAAAAFLRRFPGQPRSFADPSETIPRANVTGPRHPPPPPMGQPPPASDA